MIPRRLTLRQDTLAPSSYSLAWLGGLAFLRRGIGATNSSLPCMVLGGDGIVHEVNWNVHR